MIDNSAANFDSLDRLLLRSHNQSPLSPKTLVSHATTMTTDLFCLDYLNEACGGDKQLRTELLTIFIQQAESVADDLEKCLNDSDFDQLARQAHKFKSTALSMGMGQTADALKKIEVIAKKLFVQSPEAGDDNNAKILYLGQIRGLTHEIDLWTDQNLSTDSLHKLIDFCKLHSLNAAQEARKQLSLR